MNKADALRYQEIIRPYAEKAERDAKEQFSEFKKKLPKLYQMIPNDTLLHRIERFIYRII